MIEGLEALLALERTGTVSEAAAQLRLTQSAVTKRIQSLQIELKMKLIVPLGRRVKITAKGLALLDRARPLISELKNLANLQQSTDEFNHFSIGVSDSIAASWGPQLIKKAEKKIKTMSLDIHVHRSTLVEENVRLGRYQLGLCISPLKDSQLVGELIAEETMVMLLNGFDPSIESKKLITIEQNSATWKAISEKVQRHPKLKNFELITVESFAAIVQMVKEGFGYGLVPIGVAMTMGAPKKAIYLPLPSIKRPVKLIARKNISLLPAVQNLIEILKTTSKEMM